MSDSSSVKKVWTENFQTELEFLRLSIKIKTNSNERISTKIMEMKIDEWFVIHGVKQIIAKPF